MLCCVVVVAVDWEFSLLSFPPVVFGGVEFFFFFLLLMREKEGRLLSLSFFSFRQTLFNKEARVVYVVALSVSAVATRQKEADQGWRLMLFFFYFCLFPHPDTVGCSLLKSESKEGRLVSWTDVTEWQTTTHKHKTLTHEGTVEER